MNDRNFHEELYAYRLSQPHIQDFLFIFKNFLVEKNPLYNVITYVDLNNHKIIITTFHHDKFDDITRVILSNSGKNKYNFDNTFFEHYWSTDYFIYLPDERKQTMYWPKKIKKLIFMKWKNGI